RVHRWPLIPVGLLHQGLRPSFVLRLCGCSRSLLLWRRFLLLRRSVALLRSALLRSILLLWSVCLLLVRSLLLRVTLLPSSILLLRGVGRLPGSVESLPRSVGLRCGGGTLCPLAFRLVAGRSFGRLRGPGPGRSRSVRRRGIARIPGCVGRIVSLIART